MMKSIKEYQGYLSAIVALLGGAFYVFSLITSVQTTAAEYKKLQQQFQEKTAEERRYRLESVERRHQLDLRLNRIETLLERMDRQNAAPRRTP